MNVNSICNSTDMQTSGQGDCLIVTIASTGADLSALDGAAAATASATSVHTAEPAILLTEDEWGLSFIVFSVIALVFGMLSKLNKRS